MVQHLNQTPPLTAPQIEGLAHLVRGVEGLVEALRVAQDALGWLPPEALQLIARTLRVPLARVHGVATFYASVHLEPRGERVLRVCRGTACHVGGADRLVDALGKHFGIGLGQTTDDRTVTLESAACLGCCSLAPVLAAGEQTWGRLDGLGAVEVARTLCEEPES